MEFIDGMDAGNSYTIAGVSLLLKTPWKEKIRKEYCDFLGDSGIAKYDILFQEMPELPQVEGKKVFQNQAFSVYEDKQYGYVRVFHDERRKEIPYAVTHADWKNCKIKINILQGQRYYFEDSRNDFFHIEWERVLINEWRMILHASFIDTTDGGILFSGPSGIGKSTQADLWCDYMGSRIINGDRPILYKENEEWWGCGSPYAGSSKYHLNEACKIRAIVILKQAKQCSIKRLNTVEAFKKIYAQLVVNSWDCEYVSRVSQMALDISCEIPVYELACIPDKEAVEILNQELKKGAAVI